MTPNEWILSDDTGISSVTIWAVMMGVPNGGMVNPPWDPSDFGRCFRLLEHFPEWRSRLPEVAQRYPMWTGLVREWPELERLYREEEPSGKAPRLYERMQRLIEEGYVADGWVREGKYGWKKEAARKAGEEAKAVKIRHSWRGWPTITCEKCGMQIEYDSPRIVYRDRHGNIVAEKRNPVPPCDGGEERR